MNHEENISSQKASKYKNLSIEQRNEIIELILFQSQPISKVSKQFGISVSSTREILKIFKTEGRVGKKRTRESKKPKQLEKEPEEEDLSEELKSEEELEEEDEGDSIQKKVKTESEEEYGKLSKDLVKHFIKFLFTEYKRRKEFEQAKKSYLHLISFYKKQSSKSEFPE